ncbi:hypothetical protein ABZ766_25445 [Streptomyces sp. NPDC006670]|uniref:hypothetical protein n=1 Tax=Streptomyces sp. NPDC006670 TaxID=3154476 RepID=UPI0033D1F056
MEFYERAAGIGWDLVGACADAVRFARWLRHRGVPAANVKLLLAAAPTSHSGLNRAAADIGLEPTYVSSRDRIMDHFTPRGTVPEGDVLYVYWGGHGVLDHGNRRLLLCPDASDADPRCIELTNLQEYLSGTEVAHFPQQVFLVDACAGFIEHRRTQETPGPAPASFPAGRREAVTQFTLLAAAAGQMAGQGSVAGGSGDFSTVVTGWLEEHSPELTPDLGALVRHVKEQFATGSGPNRRRSQTPVSLFIQPLGGEAEVITPSKASAARPPRPVPRAAGRGGGGLRAGIWAGGGVLALVAMVAIVAMFLSRGDDPGQPDQVAAGAAPAASGKGPLMPSSHPPASGASSPPVSPSPATSPSGSPATLAQPAGATPGGVQESCASYQVSDVPNVFEKACVVTEGRAVSMRAYVKGAAGGTRLTVYAWVTVREGSYLYPVGGPKVWPVTVDGPEPVQLTERVVGSFQAGRDYEVHISTKLPTSAPPNAQRNPVGVTGHGQWFRY